MLYLVNPSKNFIWDKTKRFKAFYKIQFTTHLISLESSHTVTVASYIGYTRLAVVKGSWAWNVVTLTACFCNKNYETDHFLCNPSKQM